MLTKIVHLYPLCQYFFELLGETTKVLVVGTGSKCLGRSEMTRSRGETLQRRASVHVHVASIRGQTDARLYMYSMYCRHSRSRLPRGDRRAQRISPV